MATAVCIIIFLAAFMVVSRVAKVVIGISIVTKKNHPLIWHTPVFDKPDATPSLPRCIVFWVNCPKSILGVLANSFILRNLQFWVMSCVGHLRAKNGLVGIFKNLPFVEFSFACTTAIECKSQPTEILVLRSFFCRCRVTQH